MFKDLKESWQNNSYERRHRLLSFDKVTPEPLELIDMKAINEAELDEELRVDPAELMQMAIYEYITIYKRYKKAGYTDNMSESLALKYMFKKLK